jgi:myosin heavy subunit
MMRWHPEEKIMKNRLLLVVGSLLLIATAAAAFSWQKAGGLALENQAMKTKVAELERQIDEEQAKRRTATPPETEIQVSKSELMRLRNDVTLLRGSKETAVKLEEENARLTEQVKELRSQAAQSVQQLREAQNQARYAVSAQATNQSTDPLAFYRKNPELMKRYFPHLFEQEQQQQQQQQQQQPVEQEQLQQQ